MIPALSLAFYLIGLLVILTWGKLNSGWQDWYYLWDKCKDLLFITSIYLLIEKRHRWVVLAVIIYATLRVLWEIISMTTGWNVNNPGAVGWLFIILASICSYLILKELYKWHKSNGL